MRYNIKNEQILKTKPESICLSFVSKIMFFDLLRGSYFGKLNFNKRKLLNRLIYGLIRFTSGLVIASNRRSTALKISNVLTSFLRYCIFAGLQIVKKYNLLDRKVQKIISFIIHFFKHVRRFLMNMFPVNTHRFDPYKNFKFRVKWDGKYIPAITKVSPLTRMTEAVKYRSGGDQSNYRLSPGTTNFEPITLERGLSHDHAFEEWANLVFNLQGDAAVSLKNYKKNIEIELYNLQGSKVMAFKVYNCWVSEYQPLPELDANGREIAIERIVLQHEGWERDTAVSEPSET